MDNITTSEFVTIILILLSILGIWLLGKIEKRL